MFRRSFLASAAAMLTLPLSKLCEAAVMPQAITGHARTSELAMLNRPTIRDAIVTIDSDVFGCEFVNCTFALGKEPRRAGRQSWVIAYNRFTDCNTVPFPEGPFVVTANVFRVGADYQ